MSYTRSILKDPFFWPALAVGCALLSFTLWHGIGSGAGTLGYCSWVWQRYGLPPYIGCVEADFPGIFIIHRLELALFGESVFGFRLFNLVIWSAGLAMIFFLARKFTQSSVAGFLATVFFAAYYYGLDYYYEGAREEYVLWLALLALTTSVVLEKRIYLRAGLAGLLLGFAFLVKPTFGLFWPVFGVWFIFARPWTGWRKKISEAAVFSLGCLIPAAAVFLLYAHWGYLDELYEVENLLLFKAYLQKPLLYSESPYTTVVALSSGQMVALILGRMARSFPLLIAGIAAALASICVEDRGRREFFPLLLALWLASLASVLLQRSIWGYQQIPFRGFSIMLAGWGYGWMMEKTQGFKPPLRRAAIAGLSVIAFCTGWMEVPHYLRYRTPENLSKTPKQVYLREYKDVQMAADYLKSELFPDENYFYFGAISNLPFLVMHRLVSPFPFSECFFWKMRDGGENPVKERWQAEYEESLARARPRFFVFNTVMPNAMVNPQPENFEQFARDQMPRIFAILDRDYQLVKTFGRMKIYQLKSQK